MKIRTLIVDDEPLARERLRSLLGSQADVEILEECANGEEAIAAIRRLQPDLVFLDVQMPELDGFGALEKMRGERLPLVIFVTAYDQFALKAFEFHALDYLLKPFDRDRLERAVDHVRSRIQKNQTNELHQKLSSLLSVLEAEPPMGYFPDRFAVRTDGRVLFLKIDDIDYIEAADNYVSIHVGQEAHLHRETLSAMESRLPPKKFLRISRSNIVNIERIKELQPMFHGDYVVILRNGARLGLSRNYRDKLNVLLGKVD